MQSSQGVPHFTAFGLIWPRPRLLGHDSTWTDMAYYPIGVGQTVSIPVVNDGRERAQTMLRANTSAQQRQQAARHMQVYNGNPRTHGRGTAHHRRQGRDCRQTPPPQGTSGDQFEENYPKRCSPKILTPIERELRKDA